MDGRADFLAEPDPAVSGRFRIENVPVERAGPVLERAGAIVTGGLLDASGRLEFSAGTDRLHLDDLALRDLKFDYVLAEEAREEPGMEGDGNSDQAAEAVEEVVEGPHPEELQLRIDHLTVNGEFGIINQTTDPAYRVFLEDAALKLTDYSNHFLEGPAEVRLEGLFMGSGPAEARGTFRPEQRGPDFDLAIAIRETHLPAMNDLLEAYGNFDVQGGRFSFFSELTVEDGRIEGYLRPLFRDMDVYDLGEDDGLFEQLYEIVVGAIATILKNRPRGEVATEAEFSGPLEDPEASTWQIITGLVQNAFFQAILPAFAAELEEP